MLRLLLLLAAVAAEPAGGTLGRAAEDLASRAADGAQPGKVALAVLAPGAEGLREPLETALAAALARREQTVLPLRGPRADDAEGSARSLGADLLLRVRASVAGGSLVLSGEVVPTRANFFLQRAPSARAAGSRLVGVTLPADEQARALAAVRSGAGPVRLVPLAQLPGPVLALAAGTLEAGVRVAAVTPAGVALLDARGARLALHALPPRPPGPRVRDASAVICFGAFEGGRVAYAVAGWREGEVLSATGDALAHGGWFPATPPSAVPVAAGGAGTLSGAFVPGRGTLAGVSASAERGAQGTFARELLAAAAAPRPGRVAYAVLGTDYALRLLGAALAPVLPDVPAVGAGFALADLDGDGEPELVASTAQPTPPDRARVVRLGARPAIVFESFDVDGAFVAGAAADLTGDGLDDAVLAATLPGGDTQLWVVTADARAAWP